MEAQGHILIRRKAKNGIDGANGAPGKDGEPGKDGAPGKNGLQGCILRQSEWDKGIEYRNDEALTSGTRYLDIAIVTTGANTFNAYKCLKTHTSSDSILVTNTTYWQKFNSLVPVYTPLIMAQNAILRFMQGNQLLIMKPDNETVAAGFVGGDYPLWVGATTPEEAPFKVSIDGDLFCSNRDGQELLRLGRINQICGWTMTKTGFTSENYTPPSYDASGKLVSWGTGSKLFSDGGLMISPENNGILTPSTGLMQAARIVAHGNSAGILGLEVNARGNGFLNEITALKLSAINDYSNPQTPARAIQVDAGDVYIDKGNIVLRGRMIFDKEVATGSSVTLTASSGHFVWLYPVTGNLTVTVASGLPLGSWFVIGQTSEAGGSYYIKFNGSDKIVRRGKSYSQVHSHDQDPSFIFKVGSTTWILGNLPVNWIEWN